MKLTLDQIKEIQAGQLTADELAVLKVLVNFTALEAATILGVAKQSIYDTKNRAEAKIKQQGWNYGN